MNYARNYQATIKGMTPLILHQEDVGLTGEVGSGRDADGLFLFGDLDQIDVRIILRPLQEQSEPCLG